MNKARLNTLANYLESVPKKHFDLSSWIHVDGGEMEDGQLIKIGCETTCCAFGWACSIPSFRKAGLTIDWSEPSFNAKSGVCAAVDFFKISVDQALWLFDPEEYPDRQQRDPKYVIARLRDLAAEQLKWKKHENSGGSKNADRFNAFYAW